jgi:hypothetical protein
MAKSNEVPIPRDGYLTFDALTMKQHIKDRLNESGVFTDQNFEGSFISTQIDIIAYTFNALMFYLNRTSSESMFSDAQLFENMNRIVKMLDYKPIGEQTATLSFQLSAGTLLPDVYTLPRYSQLRVNSVPYSFNEDITFTKTVSGTEFLENLSDQKLLYQGQYIEYPVYTASGQENEIISLVPGNNVNIDHFNVDIYVKRNAAWEQWERIPSLYLVDSQKKGFEVRLNENGNYEIKFGNDINGEKLQSLDEVAIYYLQTDGTAGEVGVNVLPNASVVNFETLQFNEIFTDIVDTGVNILQNNSALFFDNDTVSTFADTTETVDSIRDNAPGIFRSQYRLVTQNDYQTYVRTNFANLVHDVEVINNWTYVSEVMKYYHDLGIEDPNDVSRLNFNQVQFGDACNFNNIYLITVPKTVSDAVDASSNLSPALKELIISSMRSEKVLTAETIILDPVYMAVDLALGSTVSDTSISDVSQTELVIEREQNARRASGSIQEDVARIFLNYFDRSNTVLGQTIDVNDIISSILAVEGVKTFYTRRTDGSNEQVEGLSLLSWNPVYPTDSSLVLQNTVLPIYKFPFLNDKENFINKIKVESATKIFEGVEF